MSYPPKHPKNCPWPVECLQCGQECDKENYPHGSGVVCGECADYLAKQETRSGVDYSAFDQFTLYTCGIDANKFMG